MWTRQVLSHSSRCSRTQSSTFGQTSRLDGRAPRECWLLHQRALRTTTLHQRRSTSRRMTVEVADVNAAEPAFHGAQPSAHPTSPHRGLSVRSAIAIDRECAHGNRKATDLHEYAVGRADPWDQLRAVADGSVTMTAEQHRRRRHDRNEKGPTRSKAIIMSRTDAFVLECRRLLREQVRKREEVVRVEGPLMIETCIALGWVPDVILCDARAADRLDQLEALRGHELQICTSDVVRTTMSQPRLEPAVAFGPVPTPEHVRPRRALLIGAQDPNNVGSLLRTGLAMGVDTAFMLPGTPDPFNPVVLRASAGASMALRYGNEIDGFECDLPVIAAAAHGGQENLEGVKPDRFLLALGHETRGLSASWLERGRQVTLPLDFESLGVAVAGAVLLDRILRQGE